MDKMIEVPNLSHIIKLSERKNIIISGIKKINNFDEKEFSLESIMGNIIIKGENLEMLKLDTIEGNVSIKGKINNDIFHLNIDNVNDTKTIIEIHLKHSFEKDLEWTDKIMYEVPNVVGKNVKDAKKLLSNFTVEYSGTGEKVVSQSPDANTKLEDRGTVRLLLE